MKKLVVLCVVILVGSTCIAQHRIAEQIKRNFPDDSVGNISLFNRQSLTPLRSNPLVSKLSGKLRRFYLPVVSKKYLSQIRQLNHPEKISFQIDLPGLNDKKVFLLRNHFTSPQLEIFTPTGKFIYPSSKLQKYYHGIVNGEKNSLAVLNLEDSLVTGMVSMDQDQYFLDRLKSGSFDGTVLYKESDMLDRQNFECATDDNVLGKPVKFPEAHSGVNTSSCKVVRMYLECSYQMYLDHGSNIDETMNYVLGMFNIASSIYKNDGINLVLSQVFIWTSPDIYGSLTSTYTMLPVFRERLLHQKFANFPFQADIFEFITSAHGGGGLTGGNLSGYNTNLPLSVASDMGSYADFPSYSFAVHVFTHESGHMLGSFHTHYCGWPGGPIDDCAQSEGVCDPGPVPIGGGTMMSYCHNTQYGVNFSKGFGPLPAALMRSVIEQSPFLKNCDDTSCVHAVASNISAVLTDSQLLVRWENPQGKFRIGIQPNTTSQWQYVSVTDQDSISFPRHQCEQYFKITVAAFCDAKNDFAAENMISAGDSLHVDAFVQVGRSDTLTLCPGASTIILAGSQNAAPNPNYVYEWYRNDTLIPGFNTRLLRTDKPGDYSFIINYQNCSYSSDHAQLVYTKPKTFLNAHIDGLDVTFSSPFFSGNLCNNQYSWSFGDGTGVVGDTVIHHYDEYGNYRVCLKTTDPGGTSDSSCYNLILRKEFTDIDDSLVYALTNNIDTGRYFCRKDAYFKSGDFSGGIDLPELNYQINPVHGDNIFATPVKGTIELEIYPKSFMIQEDWKTPFHDTDTGTVLQGSFPGNFELLISRMGGIASTIASLQTGTLAPPSPFVFFDQWNVIGISWGDRGVKIMANGETVDSSGAAVSLSLSDYDAFNIGYRIVPNEWRRMNGAVKHVRFSFTENDFSFSTKSPWLGADTGHLRKTICYGQSFEGHSDPGKYIMTSAKTAEGCDSISVLELNIAPGLKSLDSIFYSFGKGGNIQVQPEGGIPPYHYHWSNGSVTAAISDLAAGNYQVTITDSLGCSLKKEFPIVSVPDQQDRLQVFPNPLHERTGFTVQIASSREDDGILMIHDVVGRKMLTRSIHLIQGVNQTLISDLKTRGIFVISYSGKNVIARPVKLIIQN